jgi:hypothetical protein
VPKNDVEHVRRNLLPGIRQLVERLVHMVRNHVILHRHRDLDENIVLGLRFHIQRQLLDAQIDASGDLVQPRQLEIDARAGDALELAHALYDHGFGCVYLEKATQDRPKPKNAHDRDDHEFQNLRTLHQDPPVRILPGNDSRTGNSPHGIRRHHSGSGNFSQRRGCSGAGVAATSCRLSREYFALATRNLTRLSRVAQISEPQGELSRPATRYPEC